MTKIKNIVFDFGGILIDLDQNATYEAFSQILDIDVNAQNIHEQVGNTLLDLEKGNISDETFIWKFQHLKNGNIDPIEIIKAWNKMLVRIRPEIFDFLLDVKSKYNCILLSNTNTIHIRYVMYNILEKLHQERNWEQYFHRIFYSHEMHMRKPDHNIYNQVISEMEINPRETLFIDDTLGNVTAALECGWHSIQHDPNENIEDKLKEYIDACESI